MSADPDIPGIPPQPEPPARPAPREALATGFARGDHEPLARGFAAGGPLDQMEPGPALAGVAADAAAGGLAVLDDDQLVGVLCAARRLESWAASIRLRAVADLTARRDAAATGDRRQADHVGDEVAAALTLTGRAADRLVSLAIGVTRLPGVAAALAAGRIDLPRAAVFADELAGLGDVAAAAIAAVAGGDAAGLTTSRLRDRLHREVLAFDPQAARKRREKAEKDARVDCWAEPSGTWSMAGRDLPPARVLAADQHLDADARALKAMRRRRDAAATARRGVPRPASTASPWTPCSPPAPRWPRPGPQRRAGRQPGRCARRHERRRARRTRHPARAATPAAAMAQVTATAWVTATAPVAATIRVTVTARAAVRAGPGRAPARAPAGRQRPARGPEPG